MLQTGAKVQVFEGHTNHVKAIAFGSGGATLFSGSRDETVRTWNVMVPYPYPPPKEGWGRR